MKRGVTMALLFMTVTIKPPLFTQNTALTRDIYFLADSMNSQQQDYICQQSAVISPSVIVICL